MERMILTLHSRVLDHTSCVSLETAHCAADVSVDLDDFLDGGGFEEGGGYALFDAEDYAFARCDLRYRSETLLIVRMERCRTPIAVEPSLMASREYSTWKRRPSGEKVLFAVSYEALEYLSKDTDLMPRSK